MKWQIVQNPKNYIVENEINIVVEVKFAALKENILLWETMATSVQSLSILMLKNMEESAAPLSVFCHLVAYPSYLYWNCLDFLCLQSSLYVALFVHVAQLLCAIKKEQFLGAVGLEEKMIVLNKTKILHLQRGLRHHQYFSLNFYKFHFHQENFEGIHQLQVIHQDLGLTPHQGINPLWYPHIQKTPLNIQMIPHPLIQDPLYPQKTMILHEFFQRIADSNKYSQFLKKMLFWMCCIKPDLFWIAILNNYVKTL